MLNTFKLEILPTMMKFIYGKILPILNLIGLWQRFLPVKGILNPRYAKIYTYTAYFTKTLVIQPSDYEWTVKIEQTIFEAFEVFVK